MRSADGFEINMGFRSERPKEKATAEAFQQALGKVGIKVDSQAAARWRLLLGDRAASRPTW